MPYLLLRDPLLQTVMAEALAVVRAAVVPVVAVTDTVFVALGSMPVIQPRESKNGQKAMAAIAVSGLRQASGVGKPGTSTRSPVVVQCRILAPVWLPGGPAESSQVGAPGGRRVVVDAQGCVRHRAAYLVRWRTRPGA